MLLADCRSYVDCQEEIGRVWRNCERWTRTSILNVARMGRVPAQGLTSNSGRANKGPACRAFAALSRKKLGSLLGAPSYLIRKRPRLGRQASERTKNRRDCCQDVTVARAEA